MDFDNRKVYGDTFISDGLVINVGRRIKLSNYIKIHIKVSFDIWSKKDLETFQMMVDVRCVAF